jgi:hypothetical protein
MPPLACRTRHTPRRAAAGPRYPPRKHDTQACTRSDAQAGTHTAVPCPIPHIPRPPPPHAALTPPRRRAPSPAAQRRTGRTPSNHAARAARRATHSLKPKHAQTPPEIQAGEAPEAASEAGQRSSAPRKGGPSTLSYGAGGWGARERLRGRGAAWSTAPATSLQPHSAARISSVYPATSCTRPPLSPECAALVSRRGDVAAAVGCLEQVQATRGRRSRWGWVVREGRNWVPHVAATAGGGSCCVVRWTRTGDSRRKRGGEEAGGDGSRGADGAASAKGERPRPTTAQCV